jgi:hypothetical protein
MKIVAILPADKPITAHNYRINIGFINKLSTLCEYYPVYAYERDKVLISAREVYERDISLMLCCYLPIVTC